jgi:hypothetical protein
MRQKNKGFSKDIKEKYDICNLNLFALDTKISKNDFWNK